MRIVSAIDPSDLADQAGELALDCIRQALDKRGKAAVILAGGNTPRATYAAIAAGMRRLELPLAGISWFFGDERWVSPDDPQSNEGMARASLLGPLGAPEPTIHSWRAGAGDPVDCAAAYGEAARGVVSDITLLGLGADGHTASLFPGSRARLPGGIARPVGPDLGGEAAAIEPSGGRGWRLTLCPGILRRSRRVVFLVTGPEKAAAFRRATGGDPSTPAAWIRGGETVFFATREVLDDGGRDIRHA